jgi:Flp pilus assembly protein TadG
MKTHTGGRRRGAIAPLTALLLVFLVGLMAFAIDLGYAATVQAQLQSAADAAALAGAERLQNLYVQYYAPGQTQQAQIYNLATADTNDPNGPIRTAQKFCQSNVAGGVAVQLLTSDITFSYYDGQNPFVPASQANFPNTITVVVRRDGSANGPLGLFFAPIFGVRTLNLTATASASVYAGEVASLQVIPGVNAHILPVALDVNVWTVFDTTGVSPDGQTHLGPNGNPQLQVYPFATNTPGSFGLLDVGPPANNTPAFRAWIDNGETPNDIAYLVSNNLLPVSPSAPQPWKCGPGLHSTLVADFASQIGQPNLIPLFTPASPVPNYVAASGTGQNATYAIVGFAGVTVSQATGNGDDNMVIAIQPMAIVDPTSVLPSPSPARTSQPTNFGTTLSTFVSAKLTR